MRVLMTSFLALFLCGCASFLDFGSSNDSAGCGCKASAHSECLQSSATEPHLAICPPKPAKEIKFCGVGGFWISLRSYDEFDTAALSTSDGANLGLKRAISASGVRMVAQNGAEVHFKDTEALYAPKGGDNWLSLGECGKSGENK